MSTIYCDESIQNNYGFIVTSMIHFKNDINGLVLTELEEAGLIPFKDEFKSGSYMKGNKNLQDLRENLLGIISQYGKIGMLISPSKDRQYLGKFLIESLHDLIEINGINTTDLQIYIDEGIVNNPKSFVSYGSKYKDKIHFSENSIKILGLQLADLTAYCGGLLVLEKLVGPKKYVRIGKEHGFDPFDAELGWVLKTNIRYSFFMEPKDNKDEPGDDYFFRELLGWGVFVKGELNNLVKKAIKDSIGFTWLGCIH